ncbi:DNA adenine methylase [Roseibium sp. RKSG952]|uniref:DNA adenine methylase n=1 Tax=Roseibium sp. RKSG952 TaxID=2529384 RepID=UPI0012BC5452|nr:DNA adenine methylase [Roseibium sp. RKSG952]MTH95081.1 DNA adenine methylase [Roseibium sp. RKSG952]
MNIRASSSQKVEKPTIVRWSTRSDISPLRYPGGKRKLAPIIADLLSRTNRRTKLFIEPFAGGAAVSISLLEADLVDQIALSDADVLVASFWNTVFSSNASALADRVYDCSITLDEWKRQKDLIPETELDAAFKCFFLNRTSFSGSLHGKAGPIGGMAQTSKYPIDCRFNKSRLAERIIELSKLRGRVRFTRNESYLKTIRDVRRTRLFQEDPLSLAWYLDPPYFAKADKLYRKSFDEHDHSRLRAEIDDLPGHWILSYDNHPDARLHYGDYEGFACVNLQYTARIDERERLVATEVIVSDIIADLRRCGELMDSAELTSSPP